MLILLMLALAAPSQDSWFRPASKAFGSSVVVWRAERPPEAPPVEASPEMICTIRVLKPDPKFDARIVRPAPPDLDPKIVRPSPCRK